MSYLQGAFLTVSDRMELMENRVRHISRFMNERTQGEKYATISYGMIARSGELHYVNADHCAPMVLVLECQPDSEQ